MNIAVADEGGNIVTHVRMDGAWIGSIDIAMKSLHLARVRHLDEGSGFGNHASNDGRVMASGGIPLERDGKVVGAVGVSGRTCDQDHAVAEAGVAAF